MRFTICYALAFLSCYAQEGTIRIWGDRDMSAVVKYWAEGFRKSHPGVTFKIKLLGTDTAMASLYTGVADVALMGRNSTPTEDGAFLHLLNYTPIRFEIMTGSLDVPGKSNALSVFVHKDNPISKLTLAQLGSAFGCKDNIRTWGQLGLGDEWKNKPINLYGYDVETGTGVFFLNSVLGGSRKLNWENMREFRDIERPDGSVYEAGHQALDALQNDPNGLAVACSRYPPSQVKPVALAAAPGEPYYQATKETLISRKYPLTRSTYAFVNRPLETKVKAFLDYILSKEGQDEIDRAGDYLRVQQAFSLLSH